MRKFALYAFASCVICVMLSCTGDHGGKPPVSDDTSYWRRLRELHLGHLTSDDEEVLRSVPLSGSADVHEYLGDGWEEMSRIAALGFDHPQLSRHAHAVYAALLGMNGCGFPLLLVGDSLTRYEVFVNLSFFEKYNHELLEAFERETNTWFKQRMERVLLEKGLLK